MLVKIELICQQPAMTRPIGVIGVRSPAMGCWIGLLGADGVFWVWWIQLECRSPLRRCQWHHVTSWRVTRAGTRRSVPSSALQSRMSESLMKLSATHSPWQALLHWAQTINSVKWRIYIKVRFCLESLNFRNNCKGLLCIVIKITIYHFQKIEVKYQFGVLVNWYMYVTVTESYSMINCHFKLCCPSG